MPGSTGSVDAHDGGTKPQTRHPDPKGVELALVLRTDQYDAGTGHHDRKVVEIAAARRLRDEFALSDGDLVTIEIDQ